MARVRSMTGFGRAQGDIGPREYAVELKSVNSRYLDLKLRLPQFLQPLEQTITARIRERLDRGRVECMFLETTTGAESVELEVNWPLARRYKEIFEELQKELDFGGDLSLDLLLRQKDVLLPPPPPDLASLEEGTLQLLDKAIAELQISREREGQDLSKDLLGRIAGIEKHLEVVRESKPDSVQKIRERLLTRLQELEVAPDLDPQRFAQEVAYLADRADVTEEIVRLESHIARFRELLSAGGTVGRKLDFLVQEFNREANTIGSKAASTAAQHTVVEIKSEIERIREQVQNLE